MKNDNGVTLIELMIAMAIGLMIVMVVYSVFLAHSKGGIKQTQMTALQESSFSVIDNMEKDIMNAGCQSSTELGIQQGSGTNIIKLYYADLDNYAYSSANRTANCTQNGTTNVLYCPRKTYCNYSLGTGTNSKNLYRQCNTTTNGVTSTTTLTNSPVIANNVSYLNFKYYNHNGILIVPSESSGTLLSDEQRKCVTSVGVNLTLISNKKDPDTGDYTKLSLNRRVTIRNINENQMPTSCDN